MSPIPVTVLTGYLGAGKTTLLNHVLGGGHGGRRYAVVVNEFGDIGIDGDLVIGGDEEIVEMTNGCLCCSVRGDLVRTLRDLLRRSDAFDAILIETTGLADPGPVAQTFLVEEGVAGLARLDAVVTVVDALHLAGELKLGVEARDQIAFADLVLVNKVDLVDPETLAGVQRSVRAINPQAEIHETRLCAIDPRTIMDRGAFDLERIRLDGDPGTVTGHHDVGITSVSLRTERRINADRFQNWIQRLLMTRGQDLLRSKGILAFSDESRWFVFQGVQAVLSGAPQRAWTSDEPLVSRLVFIGRNLDEGALNEDFMACAE